MKTKQTCGRCGGTGAFSWNHFDGNKCYGCGGAGYRMVDLALVAKRKEASAKRAAAVESVRAAYKATMASVKSEFNAAFGFNLETEIGLDQLNAAVVRSTGKDLAAHCNARM